MLYSDLTGRIIKAAIKVHSTLGAGLFEQVYKSCLIHELKRSELTVLSEISLPVFYDGIEMEAGYRLDLLVEDKIIVELKAVEQFNSVHRAQLLTYLKLSQKRVGLLLNFNTEHLKNGILRVVN